MEFETNDLLQQNIYYLDHSGDDGKNYTIRFNSAFDSGNLKEVRASGQGKFVIQLAPDCCGTKYETTSRSWFYFGVQGAPLGATLTFTVQKVHVLWSLKGPLDLYKPVYKIGKRGPWKRLETNATVQEDPVDKYIETTFSFTFFQKEEEEVFFAFCYPFTYEENLELLNKFDVLYNNDPNIFYHRELLIKSPQGRDVELVTISSHDGKLPESEAYIDDNLFPLRKEQLRAKKFKQNKPVILLTARVHPGETPSSHSMNGILEFLLDKDDVRASILRKNFVFMLVPMINPDGVFNGHLRFDTFGQNLNRYYKNVDLKKHPAIYAIRELVKYLNSEERLTFYCDLHSHPGKKGSFLFGNSLDYVMQVESKLYAKALSLNCINFEYNSCNFSEKHMKARDRGEKLTKEGAGRVWVYKTSNLVHCYTMECGYHFSNELNRITMPSSTGWIEDEVADIESAIYKEPFAYYTIEIYKDLGKAMMVSLLDIYQKNPCTRLQASTTGTVDNLRVEIANTLIKAIRFRKEDKLKQKCANILEIIKERFYSDFSKKGMNLHSSQKIKQLFPLKKAAVATSLYLEPMPTMKKLTLTVEEKPRELPQENMTPQESTDVEKKEGVEPLSEQPVRPFSKQKTAIIPKEFILNKAEAKASSDKFSAKEGPIVVFEKKNSLPLTLKPLDKKGDDSGTEGSSGMNRTILFKNIQSSKGTPHMLGSAAKNGRNSILQKTGKLTTEEDFKKGSARTLKLPEVEPAISNRLMLTHNFMIEGGGRSSVGMELQSRGTLGTASRKFK